jgi:hypothetical protein
MGEKAKPSHFSSRFNGFAKSRISKGSRVTSDGGLILVRELDERLGLRASSSPGTLRDSRAHEERTPGLPLADLLRQSVYSRSAGYEDVNDAERLSQDPAFRLIGSEKTWDRGAAPSFPACRRSKRRCWPNQENFGRSWPASTANSSAKAEAIDSTAAGRAGHGLAPRSRFTASRRTAPTTATSSPPAITRCCCSIGKATAWRRNCGPATCTAPTTGTNYCLPEIERQQKHGKECRVAGRRGLRQAGDLRGAGISAV